MNDEFRQQVNTARRAGYSDDQIVSFLKQSDSRVNEAITSGYNPKEILDL
jgi:hypothetical protein